MRDINLFLYLQENLLERGEFISWIIELLDRSKSPSEDGMFRIILPLCLQYLDEFVQSELHSRRLAFLCCKKLGQLVGRLGSVAVKDEGMSSLSNQSVNNSTVFNGTPSNVPTAPNSNSNSNITPSNVAGNSNSMGNNNTNSNNSNVANNQ